MVIVENDDNSLQEEYIDYNSHEYGSGRRLPANNEEEGDNEFVEEDSMGSNNDNNDEDHKGTSALDPSNITAANHESIEGVSGTQDSIVENTSK